VPGPVFATGDTVSLHTIEEADLDFLQRGRNHPEIRRPLTDVNPRNGEQIREYFENSVSSDDGFGLLVCVDEATVDSDSPQPASSADDARPVGAVHVPWIRDKHGSGMLMYWVLPEHQGNGYVTEGTELLLDYAFAERRLGKVYAIVLETNESSQRVLERLGFQREGVQRKETFIDGERLDNYRYGLLADEWLDDSDS
jgi:RimJ/RimL family protein N-acetyltransferase